MKNKTMVSADYIKQQARQAGFNLCGIASCRALDEQKVFFKKWLIQNYNSSLSYMTRNEETRYDPSLLCDGAKSIIVCAVNYKNNTIFESPTSGTPKIASYALTLDYHATIKRMLEQIVESLREIDPKLQARIFCDTAPILEKSWAVEAGLGWIGKNSLLVTPKYGSLVLLGEIVINSEIDSYDTPFKGNRCANCTRCIDSCPNSAIVSPKVIDTGRCISRITIEKNPPEGSEKLLHGWIFGCDECQACCPFNNKTPVFDNPNFTPIVDILTLTHDFWLSIKPDQFRLMFKNTPIYRSKVETIQQNLLSL